MSTDRLWTTYYGVDGSGFSHSGLSVFDADTLAVVSSVAAPANGGATNPYRLYGLDKAPDGSVLYVGAGGTDTAAPDTVGSGVFRYDPFGGGWADLLALPRLTSGASSANRPFLPDFAVTPDGTKLWVFYNSYNPSSGAGTGLVEFAIPALPASYSSSTRTALGPASAVLATGYSPSSGTATPPRMLALSCVFSPDGATAYVQASGNLLGDGVTRQGVAVVTVATKALVRYIVPQEPGGNYRPPRGFGVSGDGTRLHVGITHGGGDLWIHSYDTATGAQLAYYLIANATSTPTNGNDSSDIPVACDPDPASAGRLFAFYKGNPPNSQGVYVNATGPTRTTGAANVYGPVGGPDASPTRARFRRGTGAVGAYILTPVNLAAATANGSNQLILTSGSTVSAGFGSTAGNYGTMDCLVLPASLVITPAVLPTAFRRDATGRPSFVTAGAAGVGLLTSRDAGHTYDPYTIAGAAATDPSLLVDPGTNTHRALVTTAPSAGVADWRVYTAAKDGEQSDWDAGTALTGLTGAWPACAQHPHERNTVACLYLQSGVLKLGVSYDFGSPASWSYLSSVGPTGLDFAKSGRGALCWLGEGLLAAWCDGSALKCAFSPDGGHTWGAVVTVATGGPYYGPAACSGLGALYVLATTATASRIYRSGDLGATWAATAMDPPPQTPGASLGFDPATGRLLVGTAVVTDDDGAHYMTP